MCFSTQNPGIMKQFERKNKAACVCVLQPNRMSIISDLYNTHRACQIMGSAC